MLYTAETKPDNASNSDAYEKFRFVPPLGEGYAGKRRPGLYILRWDRSDLLSKPSLSRLQVSGTSSHPELLSQPVFASEDRVFAVGYDYTPDKRLLGVKYCPNRPAGIWELRIPPIDSTSQNGNDEKPSEIQCTAARLTPAQLSCRCPRILEDTNGQPSHLIWIANPVGGPHASCATIHSLDLETNDQRVLVDTVLDPKPDNFPGLFTVTLPTHPFLRLGTPNGQASFLVTTSNWRSRTVVLLVSLKDGSVHNLTPDDDHHNYSWNVLTTDDHSQIVCTRSNPSVPPELVVGKVTDSVVDWQVVAKPEMSSSRMSFSSLPKVPDLILYV